MENPLQRYRVEKGLTCEQLAKELGVSPNFLIKFLNGHHTGIHIDFLMVICATTKIKPAEMFEYRQYILDEEDVA